MDSSDYIWIHMDSSGYFCRRSWILLAVSEFIFFFFFFRYFCRVLGFIWMRLNSATRHLSSQRRTQSHYKIIRYLCRRSCVHLDASKFMWIRLDSPTCSLFSKENMELLDISYIFVYSRHSFSLLLKANIEGRAASSLLKRPSFVYLIPAFLISVLGYHSSHKNKKKEVLKLESSAYPRREKMCVH